jgi:ATP-dependent Lon protease
LKTTGQLGDVMKESTTIAHTYARSFLHKTDPGGGAYTLNAVDPSPGPST